MAKHDKTDLGISTSLNPVPVVMISSSSSKVERNICTVAWAGTINSEPPMVSISLRKSRLSHEMISESGEFVINLVNKALAKSCDFCGVRSGRDVDKFSKCGLNSYPAKGLEKAVAITESPLSLSCKVKDVIELGSHDMFLAEVVAVTCDSYLMDDNGKVCLDKAGLVAYNHGEYFLLGEKLGFFGYSVAAPEVLERRMKDKS